MTNKKKIKLLKNRITKLNIKLRKLENEFWEHRERILNLVKKTHKNLMLFLDFVSGSKVPCNIEKPIEDKIFQSN